MPPEMQTLILTTVSIAFLHTIAGPDHYLPFIALSRSRSWSLQKTITCTVACGVGHVLSSVLLGLGGAALGWSFSKISWLENVRGGFAAWLLFTFGLLYTLWGIYRASANKKHKHFDLEADGSLYVYDHKHGSTPMNNTRYAVTPFVMFIIFILGPCEPMIPLLFFPAAQEHWIGNHAHICAGRLLWSCPGCYLAIGKIHARTGWCDHCPFRCRHVVDGMVSTLAFFSEHFLIYLHHYH